MNKDTTVYLVGFAIIAVMVILTLALVNGDFGGSDDAGGGTAGDIAGEPVFDENGNPVYAFDEDEEYLLKVYEWVEGDDVYNPSAEHETSPLTGVIFKAYKAQYEHALPVQAREYKTWWNGIFGDYELPGETESLLFAVQAAIGAIIIGFFIGQNSGRKKALAEMGVEQAPEQPAQ